jgi:isochorismate synthase
MFAEPRRAAGLVSHDQHIASFDAIDVFANAVDVESRVLWLCPARCEAMVGLGSAWSVSASGPRRFQDVADAWRALLADAVIDGRGPRLVGGFSFDPADVPTSVWAGFPSARLTLYGQLFSLRDGRAWLTTSRCPHPDPLSVGEGAAKRRVRAAQATRQQQRPLSPDEWQALVESVARGIREERLGVSKLVLARACAVRPTRSVEAALRSLADEYPTCTIFAFAEGPACFLGATPERLIALHDGVATTMALAGSVPRGATPEDDAALADALIRSPKEQDEHAVVVAALRDALAYVSSRVVVDAGPRLRRLSNVQHLITSIRAHIEPGHGVLDLVERVHPTPAVGGYPRERALELIRLHEALDRGWYAGPIGWLDARGEGEFAVGLRAGVVRDEIATLFAGCGIVAESDPATEYAEWGWKLRPMLAALGAAM